MLKSIIATCLLAIIISSLILVPRAYAVEATAEYYDAGSVRRELLRYAYTVASLRTEVPLIPVPAVAFRDVDLSGIQARMLIIVFPAGEGDYGDSFEIIKSFVLTFFNELKNSALNDDISLGNLASRIYVKVHETLVEKGGVKPAFLPNENMSFTVVVVLWTRTESIFQFLSKVGLEPVKDLGDNLIFFAENFVSSKIGDYLKGELRSIISNQFSRAKATFRETISGFKSTVENRIKNIQCSQVTINDITFFSIAEHVRLSLKLVLSKDISISLSIDDQQSTATSSIDTSKLEQFFREEIQGFSSDILKRYNSLSSNEINLEGLKTYINIDERKLNDIVQDTSKYFIDKISSYFDKSKPKEVGLEYWPSDIGLFTSCESLKKQVLNDLNQKIDRFQIEIENQINDFERSLEKHLDAIIDNIKNFFEKISSNVQESFKTGLREAKSTLSSELELASSYAIASASPVAFAVYALMEGIFQSLQSMVTEIMMQVYPEASNNVDESFLILEFSKEKGNDVVNVRLPTGNEVFQASSKVSFSEKFWSGAKGFAAGFVGAVASAVGLGKSVREAISLIPAVFVVNIPLKNEVSKDIVVEPNRRLKTQNVNVLLAPSQPRLYTLKADISAETALGSIKKFVDSLKGLIFSGSENNDFSQTFKSRFSSNIEEKYETQKAESIQLPFLVLTPYFILNKVNIKDGVVELNLTAIYDFASIIRVPIQKYIYTSISSINQDTIEKTLYTMLNSPIRNIVSSVVDTLFYKIFESSEYTQNQLLLAFLNALKDYISDTLSRVITQEVSQYVSKPLLNVVTKLKEYQHYVLQMITTTPTILAVRVVNSGKSGLSAYLTSLGIASTGTVNDKGYVLVRFNQVLLRASDADSLGAVPVYRRTVNGIIVHYMVPWSAVSLEPIVLPLIPVPMTRNDYLVVKFVTPFSKGVKESCRLSMAISFIGDGNLLSYVDASAASDTFSLRMDMLKGVQVLRISVSRVTVARSVRGGAVFVPVLSSMENPIFINPFNI